MTQQAFANAVVLILWLSSSWSAKLATGKPSVGASVFFGLGALLFTIWYT